MSVPIPSVVTANATLGDPASWVPIDESHGDLQNDTIWLVSIILCAFGYGIAFTLYCICARNLISQIRTGSNTRRAKAMLVYITLTTLCGTVYFASETRVALNGFVRYRAFPGGPWAYTLYAFSSTENLVAIVSYFVVNWMADAMLIWRVYILYSSKKYAWLVTSLPAVLYLASICMSAAMIHQISIPTQTLWSPSALPFGFAYFILTATLTILSNFLMTIRLLVARKHYIDAMGNTSHAKRYLSIVTMLVESSALFAIWSIIFVGLYAVSHPLQNIFFATLVDVAIVAMLLIMFRVSQDRAWKPETESALNGMEWRDASTIRGSSRYIKPSFQSRNGASATRLENLVTVETFTVDDNKMRIDVEPCA
ncbi:hypothetical protein NP233_g12273 [Leucocoprinus birnbaumii]|uniref:Uncharacterized protein n=1 Tax=Leucocoprinus birnbaumii TaxID=56174 RepID=A0AAD5VGL1_9AGAR|nr:hypothetical protein NP233_g12273 [Leucocoprinus birnbaumii]